MFVDEFIALKHLYCFSRGDYDERSAEKNARRISSFLSESVPRLELIIFSEMVTSNFQAQLSRLTFFRNQGRVSPLLSGLFTFG